MVEIHVLGREFLVVTNGVGNTLTGAYETEYEA